MMTTNAAMNDSIISGFGWETRSSGVKGEGIFATMALAAGTPLYHYRNCPRMSNAQTRVFLQTLRGPDPHHNESQFLQVDRDLFAWVGTPFDPPRYIPPHNHSCSPNCVIEWSTLTMKTWRPIRTGEELTWDYSLSMGPQETWRLPCRCGSRICRGTVGRFVDLPPDVQQRYLSASVVPMFVLEQVAVF